MQAARTVKQLPTTLMIPGWFDHMLLVRLITRARPPLVSVRTVIGSLLLLGALLAGLGTLGAYKSAESTCMERLPRFPDAAAYCSQYGPLPSDYASLSGGDAIRAYCAARQGQDGLAYCMEHRARDWQGTLKIAAVLGAFGLLLTVSWAMARSRTPAFVEVLRSRPQDVVWVYERVKRQGSVVWHDVILGLANWQTVEFDIGDEAPRAVFSALAQVTPWATFGYSAQAEAAFRQAPAQLRRG